MSALKVVIERPPHKRSDGCHMKSSSGSLLTSWTSCGAHHQGPFHSCPPSCIPGTGQEVYWCEKGLVVLSINTGGEKTVEDLHVGFSSDSCVKTWPMWCGFVYTGSSKSHCSTFSSFPRLSAADAAAVWLLNPHNLPPAEGDWAYWLPVHWAHRLDLVIIIPWLCVDINPSEIIKLSSSWCCSRVIGECLRTAISPLKP